MKGKQVWEMTDKELADKLAELKSELFFLRFKNATNQLTNPKILAETERNQESGREQRGLINGGHYGKKSEKRKSGYRCQR